MDRDGNGTIDSGAELFGDATRLENGMFAANGFEALGQLDANRDGTIDVLDPLWDHLLLWFDVDHDGVSTEPELVPITTSEVRAINTAYQRSRRIDAFGNEYRYRSEFLRKNGWRRCFDVYLTSVD